MPKVKDELADFILINQEGSLKQTNWNVGEFFVLAKFQGQGIGEVPAYHLWHMHPREWEVSVMAKNQYALKFWRKITHRFALKGYTEELMIITNDVE